MQRRDKQQGNGYDVVFYVGADPRLYNEDYRPARIRRIVKKNLQELKSAVGERLLYTEAYIVPHPYGYIYKA
jgi:hypothetical protein